MSKYDSNYPRAISIEKSFSRLKNIDRSIGDEGLPSTYIGVRWKSNMRAGPRWEASRWRKPDDIGDPFQNRIRTNRLFNFRNDSKEMLKTQESKLILNGYDTHNESISTIGTPYDNTYTLPSMSSVLNIHKERSSSVCSRLFQHKEENDNFENILNVKMKPFYKDLAKRSRSVQKQFHTVEQNNSAYISYTHMPNALMAKASKPCLPKLSKKYES